MTTSYRVEITRNPKCDDRCSCCFQFMGEYYDLTLGMLGTVSICHQCTTRLRDRISQVQTNAEKENKRVV